MAILLSSNYISFMSFTQFNSPVDSSSTSPSAPSMESPQHSSSSSSSSSSMTDIPSYDEYIVLAKQHNWTPVDPLQKLKDISYKLSQVINLYNSSQTHEYMKLMSQEVQFILQVLIKSTNQTFDLTEIFFEGFEGIHRALYHLEKQVLQRNKERYVYFSLSVTFIRVITRAEAEYYTQQYLYMFVTVSF